MSNEQANVQVVQRMFAAFGEGNLAAALGTLAEDVDFQSPVTRNPSPEMSWAKPRRGRDEVTAFFRELAEKVQLERMETLHYTAQGNRVVVEGRNRGTVRATGRTYEHDWVMVFVLSESKIVKNWHYYDTADLLVAFRSD